MLRMETTKQKKESTIEKASTFYPALQIMFLSYLSLPHNKPCSFPLLGHECKFGYTLSAPIRLAGGLRCPCDTLCIFTLLGHECAYGYTLSAPSHLAGFPLCLRNTPHSLSLLGHEHTYGHMSQFGGVYVMPKIQVSRHSCVLLDVYIDACPFLV